MQVLGTIIVISEVYASSLRRIRGVAGIEALIGATAASAAVAVAVVAKEARAKRTVGCWPEDGASAEKGGKHGQAGGDYASIQFDRAAMREGNVSFD